MKNTNGVILIAGATGSGTCRTSSIVRVIKKYAAFRDWDASLKENEQRPRGRYFKSRRAKVLRLLKTVKLDEPIEVDIKGFTHPN